MAETLTIHPEGDDLTVQFDNYSPKVRIDAFSWLHMERCTVSLTPAEVRVVARALVEHATVLETRNGR